MMKITGYKIQHALRELAHEREIAASQFESGLKKFPGEEKPHPEDSMKAYQTIEKLIATLQTAQAEYNLQVKVRVMGEIMPLAQAVKMVGGAGRVEKMWRSACGAKHDMYDRYDSFSQQTTRGADVVVAARTISVPDTMKAAKVASRWASALREAIQVANATEVKIERLDPTTLAEVW